MSERDKDYELQQEIISEIYTFRDSLATGLSNRYGITKNDALKMVLRSHYRMEIAADDYTRKSLEFYVREIARLEEL